MNRRLAIGISLALALVLTLTIFITTRKDYSTVTKTEDVAVAVNYIPVGTIITEEDIEKQAVIKSAVKGMATYEEVIGKTSTVGILQGQHIYQNSLSNTLLPKEGCVEILIDTDIAKSAYAMPGEKVNIHVLTSEFRDFNADGQHIRNLSDLKQFAPILLEDVTVLRALTTDGENVGAEGGGFLGIERGEVSVIGLEIPKEYAEQVVYSAFNKAIYLSKINFIKGAEGIPTHNSDLEEIFTHNSDLEETQVVGDEVEEGEEISVE